MQCLTLLLLTWAVLAALWLGTLSGPAWRTGWIYPLLPLAAAGLHRAMPGIPVLPAWLDAAAWLWAALTAVWLLSLVRRDSSIMDIAYGYLMCALPWCLWLQHGADPQAWWALLLGTLGFGRYAAYTPGAICRMARTRAMRAGASARAPHGGGAATSRCSCCRAW